MDVKLFMLDYKFKTTINSAFIIRIKNNEISERMAKRCALSCEKINQPYQFFDAVDGTGSELIYPENVHPIINLLKKSNTSLTQAEIACALSHFLLWVKCAELDEPIIILEHDAIMLQPYLEHPFFNVISYLGCAEQVLQGWQTFYPMPPHGQLNENYRFILRAHAYAIDSMVARQMVAKMIKGGITAISDVFMRIDEFAIIQQGIYAFDKADNVTTIPARENKDPNKKHERHMLETY